MATQVVPTINGVAGSNADLPLNTLVQLNNNNAGGESTWLWSIISQPEGPADVLSDASIQNPTFTPKKEGSYLIQLIVNLGITGEKSGRVIAGVLYLKTAQRAPAPQEQAEVDPIAGWALALNRQWSELNQIATSGVVVVAQAVGTLPLVGQVVQFPGSTTIKLGLPGQEVVPTCSVAHGNDSAAMAMPLGIFLGKVKGGGAAGVNDLVRVQVIGAVRQVTALPPGTQPGDPVWVGDSGSPVINPGTTARRIGVVMSGIERDIWLDGAPQNQQTIVLGFLGTPGNSQEILRYVAAKAINLPVNLAGSLGSCRVNPGADASFAIRLNGTLLGAVVFRTTGSVDFSFPNVARMVPGDVLTLTASASADVTLAGLAVTFLVG